MISVVASRSAALVSLVATAPGGRSSAAGGGGAPVTAVEQTAAAVVAAQASEEVCGARGHAAAATPVQMPLLLLTRLPRQRPLSEPREALQLGSVPPAISLTSRFVPRCSVRRQHGTLLASPSKTRAGEANESAAP